MSHTLPTISEAVIRDGVTAGLRLLSTGLYQREHCLLLEHHLGLDGLHEGVGGSVRYADLSWLDRIVAAWPDEFGRSKGDAHIRRKIEERFADGIPCLVSDKDGVIEGAVWCMPWRCDPGLRSTEDSRDAFEICDLFVVRECRGKGVGRQLLVHALSMMAQHGKKTAYSRILAERHASIALHLSAGFRTLGLMKCVTALGWHRRCLVPLTKVGRGDIRGMQMPACVLLTRTAWGGTLEAIRSLGSRGVPVHVFVLNGDPTPYAKSRYCRETRTLVGQEPMSVRRELVEWCVRQRLSQRPLLIPMTDIASTFVAEERSSLEEYFTIGAPRPEIVMSLLDKGQAGPLAAKCGLDVPHSAVVRTLDDLEAAATTMKYPAIAKPVWWREKGRAGFKTVVFKDRESLVARLAPLLDGDTSVLVQEYVEGVDQDIETFMFYRDREGSVWGCTSRKLRQSPPGAGIMASGHAVELPQLRRLSAMFLEKIDYRGLGGVEFKRTGMTLSYIETSVRPEAIHGLSRKAGIDLMWIAYCDYCLGGLAEEPSRQEEAFYLDWAAFKESYGRRHVVSWLLALLKILSKGRLKIAVCELRDPLPSCCLAYRHLRERIYRSLGKAR